MQPTATVHLGITYAIEEVPEPGAFWLVVTALLVGLCVSVHRRAALLQPASPRRSWHVLRGHSAGRARFAAALKVGKTLGASVAQLRAETEAIYEQRSRTTQWQT